ncbi:WD40/YVTN/BNR-like repeat-containing protein [Catenovulum maritimum]|uniref:WD40/YVTN/BNR-like repeat-containing protein n=1 Tax=Catenovulum maritimum TaxID=1513271 RepID=UPI0006603CDD|nr:YCF48-related protein [Catenovulum maritimum]
MHFRRISGFVVGLVVSLIFSAHASAKYKPLILDMIQVNSGQYLAVGERGIVVSYQLKETSQGIAQTNQTEIETPTSFTLTSITRTEDTYWAVGHNSTILRSTDAGNTWSINFQANSHSPFLDIIFLTPNEGIAIGAYGLFYRTLDGGKTWQKEVKLGFLIEDDQLYLKDLKMSEPEFFQQELAALQPHLNQIISHGDTLILVGEMGLVAVSRDKGSSWQRLPDVYSGSLFDAAIYYEKLIVSGLRGHIFEIDIDWHNLTFIESRQINLSQPVNINRITIDLTQNQIYLVGNSSHVWIWDGVSANAKLHIGDKKLSQQDNIASITVAEKYLLLTGDLGISLVNRAKSEP